MFLVSAGCSDSAKNAEYIEGPVPFHHTIIDATPNTGEDCCTDVCALGDINGDGYADVILGSENASADGLVWYEYPLWVRHAVASGQFTTDGKASDMDRDGDLDIVISDHGRGIFWFENPGDKNSTDGWARHLIGEGYAHDLEVGDIDHDGYPEVVTCDKKSVTLWHQGGSQSWSRHVLSRRTGEGIELADIDGDADLDLFFGPQWLEAPEHIDSDPWPTHRFADAWPEDTRVETADLNDDGRLDAVLTVSEGPGKIAWFEAPENPRNVPWLRHPVSEDMLEGAHSLQIADMDLDGDSDIVTAEMHTSPQRRVLVFLSKDAGWTPEILSHEGSHNLVVGDLDGDGDPDIVGKNYAGRGRALEMWENLTEDLRGVPPEAHAVPDIPLWRYTAIDQERGPDQQGKTGLVFADVNRDGRDDVIAGSIVYLNPGNQLTGPWEARPLPKEVDVFFSVDVDGDKQSDLVGMSGTSLIWLEATDDSLRDWRSVEVGHVPDERTQGYATAQIVPGGKPELLFTRGKNLYYAVLPKAGEEEHPWDLVHLSDATEEEGIAVGDIDGDGDLDIATYAKDGHHAIWFEHPRREGDWLVHQIGASGRWMDRIGLADINGDGRLDVVSTEETLDLQYNARVWWFEAPEDPRNGRWNRHAIATLRSVNSMDLSDLDGDGDVDIVLAEHTDLKGNAGAADNFTAVFFNEDHGTKWRVETVEIGPHSSHLGTRLHDLDEDGTPEIVSIAWSQYRSVHLWRRTAPFNRPGRKHNLPLGTVSGSARKD